MLDNRTIAAISSPPGSSHRGIVRLSGPRAIDIAARRFTSRVPLSVSPGHRRLDGALLLAPDLSLPAVVYLFRAPRSYTREDIVELHVPGSPGLLALILDALLADGARAAQPGEFTARAFHHGAIDLSQAEGIAEMIAARSDAQLRAAQRLLDGALSRAATAARETLTDLRALVEAALDFADEDIEFITPAQLVERLDAVAAALRETACTDARTQRLADPPRIVLAGPPNAGKSTLFNRLTGMDRALCSPVAGTTRDAIAAPIRLADAEAVLIDTAGLGVIAGDIDACAARATGAAVDSAALILWLTDARDPRAPDALAAGPAPLIVAINKCDAAAPDQIASARGVISSRVDPTVSIRVISARTGEGCDTLRDEMNARLGAADAAAAHGVLLSADLTAAIDAALGCIDRAIDLARPSRDALAQAELVAAELAGAADSLARLTGDHSIEDVYDRIFSRFCIGK